MTLTEKIDQELKAAMIAKEADKTSVLRLLKSALKYTALEKKTDALDDAQVQQLIQKQIKQRRESIEQSVKAGRTDLADKEKREIRILETYLPKQISDAELDQLAAQTAKALGATGKKDFGKVMKELKSKLAGQADAQRISGAVGKILK